MADSRPRRYPSPVEPAVFIDRDNTLIHNDGDLGDPEQARLIDGVASGLKALREAGYRLIVVTNQGGVARGKFSENDVDAVHQKIASLVDEAADRARIIDRFYYCPYHPEAEIEAYRRDHPWRKPNPGMLLQASRDLGLDLARSWMIGDQARDISAGRSAGCRTVLITENGRLAEEAHPTATVRTFSQAVQHILEESPPPRARSEGGASRPALGGLGGEISRAGDQAQGHNLHRAILDLTEELRSRRMRRAEFTHLRMAAMACQLVALLLALFGLLQLDATDVFIKWMIGAILAQLATLALLLLDLSG
ncbi:MAG: HAD family hydrolase [Phycisphaerales bacterium]|nr:MAG: HAD family hydrolase [Phycisphaerales bacterium]